MQPMPEKPTAAAAMPSAPEAPPAKVESKPGAARNDEAYVADQAAQRSAATRFDNTRFRRKQDAGKTPR